MVERVVRGKKKRILVIDDDSEIAEIIEDVLKEHNYEVVSVQDGLRGIEATNRQEFHLILLDLRMPLFSGFWICNALKARPKTKDIPVVVVSAVASEEDVEKVRGLGAKAFVKKPFQVHELLDVVKKTIS
jgi:DNA-binding response OmpR family regulator